MTRVFISYRRDDSVGVTWRLHRALGRQVGSNLIFMDTKDIRGGEDIPWAISEALESSAVVLAVIGPSWLDARNADGGRRIEDPSDFVRIEISRALQSPAHVIPVLVAGARMPPAELLPPEVRAIAARQACVLRDACWDEDIGELVLRVRLHFGHPDTLDRSPAEVRKSFQAIPPPDRGLGTFAFICGLLGLVSLPIGVGIVYNWHQFEKRAISTTAQVMRRSPDATGGRFDPDPQMQFATTSGVVVHATLRNSWSPDAYHDGDTVSILYDPSAPTRIGVGAFREKWGFALAFGGVGMLLIAVALIPVAVRLRFRRRARRLVRRGRPIVATYESVEEVGFSRFFGRAFRVVAKWQDPATRTVVYFRSPPLSVRPAANIDQMETIDVLVDPLVPDDYIMDLSDFKRPRPRSD
jgi:hypothetical protein